MQKKQKSIGAKQLSALPIIFPPYGVVNTENTKFLKDKPIAKGFRLNPLSPDSDYAEWSKWLDALASDMSDWLWPVFQGSAWVGSSTAQCTELTKADLEIILEIQAQKRTNDDIRGDGKTPGKHSVAFELEDEKMPSTTFMFYRSDFPSVLVKSFLGALYSGGIEIARPASQEMKRRFQRPRPLQTALMLGYPDVEVRPSASAITPSMISGHCIQSSMGICAIEASIGDELKQLGDLFDDVQRFLIDVGDRRVWAGLHYPSDNISSWYVCMKLCNHIFRDNPNQIRRNLWQAIKTHSMVFKAIDAYPDKTIYKPMMDKLELAAKNG